MSAKGTTWTKADKVISVKFQNNPDELPEWVYKLIDTLSAEINLLRQQNIKLKKINDEQKIN